jgi:hypothetical protein
MVRVIAEFYERMNRERERARCRVGQGAEKTNKQRED